MKFGIYLYKQGTITAEQLIAAYELQSQRMLPLGLVAIEDGKLAVRDVLSILRVQSDLPNDRFGDIAIELGLLNQRDLGELLMAQSDRMVPIGDCLIELGAITQQQLDESKAAFRRERERGGVQHVQHVINRLPEAAQLAALELAPMA